MARTSLTAAISSFVTGAAPAVPKQRRKASMEDSLRASARVDNVGTREQNSNGSINTTAVSRAWQQEAWARYDEVGEVRYAAGFIGACLSRCNLTIGIPDNKGNIGPCFDENGDPLKDEQGNVLPGLDRAVEALDLIRMLKNDVNGQSQLLRAMGINITMAGEFHLVGSGPSIDSALTPAVGEINQWEVLSTREFIPQGEDYLRTPMPGATPQEIKGEAVHVVRIWRSHPCWSELPDSSIRAVLDILEELVLLTREVRGETLSRLSNGKVFIVPEEIEWPDDKNEDGSSEAGDSFTRDLIRTMSTAISDKGSAAGIAPFIMRVPADLIDKITTIDLSRSNPSDSSAKRTEAVQRFAQGVDLPVEIVVGHGGTSFANAVVIDDSTYKVHIEPVLEIICDALTAGYLRPAMGDTPLVVFYDSTELVSRPNRSADAKDLHDRFAVSDATLRTSAGFSESDKPDEDEILQRIKLKQLANIRQTIPATPGQLDTEDENAAQGDPGGTSTLTPPGTPAAPGADVPQGQSTATDTLAASVRAVSQVSVDRALRRAGARLRSKSAKTMALREVLSRVPDVEVAATLGPAHLEKIVGDEDLLRGEFDDLHAWALSASGDADYAKRLLDTCVTITNERLYKPREPFPFHELPQPHG